MTSDSKKFENAAASGQPFVTRRTYSDGHARYVLLMDDKYWHCSEWEFEMIMDKGHHPEDIGMISSDSEDD